MGITSKYESLKALLCTEVWRFRKWQYDADSRLGFIMVRLVTLRGTKSEKYLPRWGV